MVYNKAKLNAPDFLNMYKVKVELPAKQVLFKIVKYQIITVSHIVDFFVH